MFLCLFSLATISAAQPGYVQTWDFEGGFGGWQHEINLFDANEYNADDGVAPGRSGNYCIRTIVNSRVFSQSTSGSFNAVKSIRLRDGFRSADFKAYVDGTGYAVFKYPKTFTKGRTYEASIWLSSPTGITVEFLIRRQGPHYDACAIRKVTVGAGWQEVKIKGGFEDDAAGFLGINYLSDGTLFIDDARLEDVTESVTHQPPANQSPVDRSYFGIHLNELGSHFIWPDFNPGTLRIWASGTDWAHLQPNAGSIDFNRLDLFVQHRENYSPDANLVYTFGYSPAWATKNGIAGSAPVMQHWENFVREIGNRYKGKIRYYEIWNEYDQNIFWSGTAGEMLQMTIAARNILKGIDPEIRILSPNVTVHGYRQLDEFLRAGGGQYVDIISFHNYQPKKPELSIPKIVAFSDLMDQHSISVPLWNSEGNIGYSLDDPTLSQEPPPPALTTDEAIAAISRSFIVQRLYGVQNFNVYAYEGSVMGPLYVRLTNPPYTPTKADTAYLRTSQWLEGSSIISKTVDDNGKRWKVVLDRGAETTWLLWHTEGENTYEVSPDLEVQWIKHLDGPDEPSPGNLIPIGIKPVLISVVPSNSLSGRARATETDNSGSAAVEIETNIQNYPNPFKGKTTINYHLGEETPVTITVYDLFGRVIAELINTKQPAGEYNVTFNAPRTAHAIYLAEVKTSKMKLRLKMVAVD